MQRPLINIVIPVYNAESVLAKNLSAVIHFLESNCPYDYEIVIANNASTDRTLETARCVEAQYRKVRVLHLDAKGRGRALKQPWNESRATVLSYMDVDLSTDISAFLPMIEAVNSRECDLAVGSRLLKASSTNRSLKRELISRTYNLLVKILFKTRFSDAQCGFKALSKEAATNLLPLVEDDGWFMDTELLVIAEKLEYRILDLPVKWTENTDSRVNIGRTILADLKGLARLRRSLARGKYRRG